MGKKDRIAKRYIHLHKICDATRRVGVLAPKGIKRKGNILACLMSLSSSPIAEENRCS